MSVLQIVASSIPNGENNIGVFLFGNRHHLTAITTELVVVAKSVVRRNTRWQELVINRKRKLGRVMEDTEAWDLLSP